MYPFDSHCSQFIGEVYQISISFGPDTGMQSPPPAIAWCGHLWRGHPGLAASDCSWQDGASLVVTSQDLRHAAV